MVESHASTEKSRAIQWLRQIVKNPPSHTRLKPCTFPFQLDHIHPGSSMAHAQQLRAKPQSRAHHQRRQTHHAPRETLAPGRLFNASSVAS